MKHAFAFSLLALTLVACGDKSSSDQKKLEEIANQAPPSSSASAPSGQRQSLQDIAKQAPPSKSVK
jgi:hypothetical protein